MRGFYGGDVILGDEKKAIMRGEWNFKLNLIGGRIWTIPSVLDIAKLAKNLIFVIKI